MLFPRGRACSVAPAAAHRMLPGPWAGTNKAGSMPCLAAIALEAARQAPAQSPASQALRQAAVPFVRARGPSQRQFALIHRGDGQYCNVGRLRNAERSAPGKFSTALYRDRPFGALLRRDNRLHDGMRDDEAMPLAGLDRSLAALAR